MSTDSTRIFVTADGRNVLLTFVLVSSLFLLWGFCNGMIDVMDKHFQEELHLGLAQSAWVQFAHYLGYFLMSLPAGWLAARFGYKGGILLGLLLVAVGGLWFIPATRIVAFWAFLLGVCLIASGLAFLETVANPYTTVLGSERYAATRINLAQSCNGIGWILGPIAGAVFFYSKNSAGQSTGSHLLWVPYAGVSALVIVLATIFYFASIPDLTAPTSHTHEKQGDRSESIWAHSHFTWAVVAQFLYVAAQAGIFSFLINYLTTEPPPISASWSAWIAHRAYSAPQWLRGFLEGWLEPAKAGGFVMSDKLASYLTSLAFVCFLIGRFTGAGMLRVLSAHRMLGWYGLINVFLCFLVCLKLGWLSVMCVFLTYFFMSIMFPTIFALGIFGLGKRAKRASSYIVMAIVGGAVLPKVMGTVADHYNVSRSFIVPLICFIFIAYYGFQWPKLSRAESLHGLSLAQGH